MKASSMAGLFGAVWLVEFAATRGGIGLMLSSIYFAAALICRAIEERP